jgi:hypothetical protein
MGGIGERRSLCGRGELERGDRFLNEGVGKRRSLFGRKELERGDRFLNGRIGERRSLFRTSVNTGRTTAKIFLYQK